MAIHTSSQDGVLTIRLLDERLIDQAQIQRLVDDVTAALGKSEEENIVLDFSQVQFMASAMLGKLVQLNKKSKEWKAKLKLCSISPDIYEVFKITKLHKVFDIEKDEEAARKAFQKRGLFR
ncbi:MAG: STAS domain-containing protein [Planctomycetota bacterium]